MCDDGCPIRRARDAELRGADPSRRQFLTQSALAAIAAVLAGACGDGVIGGIGPDGQVEGPPVTVDEPFTFRVADYPALQQVGGIARVNGNAPNPIAVSRTGPTTFLALSLVCPHAGYKPIAVDPGGFYCPNHEAEFAADGTWVGGQRTKSLQSYPTAYDPAAGTVTIG